MIVATQVRNSRLEFLTLRFLRPLLHLLQGGDRLRWCVAHRLDKLGDIEASLF
ncbi:MAG: hypothetical protein KME32_00825 [Mojavia pulchra JT2-VF2]|uniref:Uncharacterized protein n=1 Tax=Mojavia pulchra JT2-VF2 TaxID=287848 RepID=A0A951PSY5_9NOST|nr:hypothetical protein [Mojavia pulchra JT2-VF2]